jgi:hypothetical protein
MPRHLRAAALASPPRHLRAAALVLAAALGLAPAGAAAQTPPTTPDALPTTRPPPPRFDRQAPPGAPGPAVEQLQPPASTGLPPPPIRAEPPPRPESGLGRPAGAPAPGLPSPAPGGVPGPQAGPDPGAQLLTPLDMVQRAWDRPVAAPGQVAPGSRLHYYEAFATYEAVLRPLMVTLVLLPQCERVASVHASDTGNFRIVWARPEDPRAPGMQRSLLTVQPLCTECDANVIVTGESGRSYPFVVRSTAIDAGFVSDQRVWVEDPTWCPERSRDAAVAGPPPAGTGLVPVRDPARSPALSQAGAGLALDRIEFDAYRVVAQTDLAARRIAPSRVFSDGVFVYLDFGHQESPRFPVVAEVINGIETPVQTWRTGARGQILQIATQGDLTLRTTEDVVCLFRLDHDARTPLPAGVVVDPSLRPPAR